MATHYWHNYVGADGLGHFARCAFAWHSVPYLPGLPPLNNSVLSAAGAVKGLEMLSLPPGWTGAAHHEPVVQLLIYLSGKGEWITAANESHVFRAGDLYLGEDQLATAGHTSRTLGSEPLVAALVQLERSPTREKPCWLSSSPPPPPPPRPSLATSSLATSTRCPLDPCAAKAVRTGWEVFTFTKSTNWSGALYNWSAITTIAYAGYATPSAESVCLAHSHGVRVVLSTGAETNFTNATARRTLVDRLLQQALDLGTDGVNLDIERFSGDRDGLTTFVRELCAAFRDSIKTAQLSFDLAIAPSGQTARYDHRALAEAVDFIVPMAYDENWGSLSPAANCPIAALRTGVVEYAALGVPASKLVVALPWYGTSWPCDDPTRGAPCATSLGSRAWNQVVSQPAVAGIVARVPRQNTSAVALDEPSQTRHFEYADDPSDPTSARHVAWYDDAYTLRAKVGALAGAGVRGVGMWYAECVVGEAAADVAGMWAAALGN